jgi:hypothetical protein
MIRLVLSAPSSRAAKALGCGIILLNALFGLVAAAAVAFLVTR